MNCPPLDNPLWQFSRYTYALPGVAAQCLSLQERYGADVNLLLCLLWLGEEGCQLDADELALARELVQHWHEDVVKALRIVRQDMKVKTLNKAQSQLRERIKLLELEAEQQQQALLYEWCLSQCFTVSQSETAALKQRNLGHYLAYLAVPKGQWAAIHGVLIKEDA